MIDINSLPLLLSNTFFVVFSLLIYQLFIYEKPFTSKTKKWGLFFLAAAVMILCINLPMKFGTEYLFDFRQIPMVVGFLYGGPAVGTGLYLILVIFRFTIGGIGAVGAFFENTCILITLFFLFKHYKTASRKEKYSFIFFLTLVSLFVSAILYMLLVGREDFILFSAVQLQLYIIQTGILCLCVYFIEVMVSNKKMRDKLFQTEKMELVSHLAASISHEIRNPLTVTHGFLQLLNEDSIPEQKRKEYINLSTKEIERAVGIITDYLTFARPSIEKKERISVSHELAEIIEMMSPYAKMNSVKFISNISPDCMMMLDKQKFKQCILNIVKNGIEAMPDGGNIHIHTHLNQYHYVIVIEDTGIGMSEEQIKRLGEPYFSTKEKGTGLGMMVVYSNIKAMHGKIYVQSEVGKGTKFTIQFPVVENAIFSEE
jgi:two-component system, sporulation sensor kinase B